MRGEREPLSHIADGVAASLWHDLAQPTLDCRHALLSAESVNSVNSWQTRVDSERG